jgi:hypothetical protein
MKTGKEAAILTRLGKNTNVPVPDLIALDTTTTNTLDLEHLISRRCWGVTVSDFYDILSTREMVHILLQLIDILI